MVDPTVGTFIGIGISGCGSFLTAGGFVVQKITHNKDNQKTADGEKSVHFTCRPMWWLGMTMIIVASLCNGWSLAFAPLSVIEPLCGFTVVVITLLAVVFLKETLTTREALCFGIVIIGIVLTSAFGSHTSRDFTVDQFNHMFTGCQFNLENNGPCSDNSTSQAGIGHTCEDNRAWYTADCDWGAILVYYITIVTVMGINLVLQNTPGLEATWPRLNAFGYANMAAICAGQQNMFFKISVELLATSFAEGENQFARGVTYVYLSVFLILAVSQVWFLNLGLARHPAVNYLPIYQAMLVVWGSMAGGIYFGEFIGFTTLQGAMYSLGLCLVAGGLFALTTMKPKDESQAGTDASAVKGGRHNPSDEYVGGLQQCCMDVDANSNMYNGAMVMSTHRSMKMIEEQDTPRMGGAGSDTAFEDCQAGANSKSADDGVVEDHGSI